jgi:hypothetical protein
MKALKAYGIDLNIHYTSFDVQSCLLHRHTSEGRTCEIFR